MGRTMINVGAVLDATGQINSAKSSVSSAKSAFSQTKNQIDGKIRNRSNIQSRLNTVQNQLSNIGTKIGKISSMVQSGATLYRTTDDKVDSMAKSMDNRIGGGRAYISGVYATYFSNDGDIEEIKKKTAVLGDPTYRPKNILENIVSLAGVVGAVSGAIWTNTSGTNCADKDGIDEISADEDSVFVKILKDDWKLEGAVLSGAKTGTGEFLGVGASGTAAGDLIGGSIKTKSEAKWDIKEKDASIEKSITAEGHLAQGSLEGNYGVLGGKIEGKVGTVGATGTIGVSLYKDGKLSPALQAEIKAKAAVAEGEAEVKIGNEEFNGHIKGEGTVLGAEAGASGGAGMITYKDETTGQTKTELGLEGKLEAEAYLAEGTVSGGFTIFGVDIDIGLSGKAGGAGVEAGGRVTTGGVSGKIGAGLGLGLGLELSIDWSDFSLW